VIAADGALALADEDRVQALIYALITGNWED
jgi:hypothetical protein